MIVHVTKVQVLGFILMEKVIGKTPLLLLYQEENTQKEAITTLR